MNIYLLVDDADDVMKKSISAGGKLITPLNDEGDGDRRGTMQDPFGHIWMVATHKRDVSNDDYRKSTGAAGYKVEFPTEGERSKLTPARWGGANRSVKREAINREARSGGSRRGDCNQQEKGRRRWSPDAALVHE